MRRGTLVCRRRGWSVPQKFYVLTKPHAVNLVKSRFSQGWWKVGFDFIKYVCRSQIQNALVCRNIKTFEKRCSIARVASKSIAIDRSIVECQLVDPAWFAMNWHDTSKEHFQCIFQRVHKNNPWIGWSRTFLVPLAMVDQWPWASKVDAAKVLWYVIILLRNNHDFGVTDTLPSICASLTEAMVHCICTCDAQLRHFVLETYYRPVDRELSVNKNFSGRSQSRTSWPPILYCYAETGEKKPA